MKKMICLLTCLSGVLTAETNPSNLAELGLKMQYTQRCQTPSDINQHLPHLRRLAMKCSSVVEVGVASMNSTWGILQGLSESPDENKSYKGIDLYRPNEEMLNYAKAIANEHGVAFSFVQGNDINPNVDIEISDMLFIDSLHTYAHLTTELEKFSPKIRKFIAMHDTSEPFAYEGEGYNGDYSEYPDSVDRQKRGTWPAIWDFLVRHPEWKLQERHFNNFGFTVLKRVSQIP